MTFRHVWQLIGMLCGLLPAFAAHAQLAADLSLSSENIFRGNSLSDGDPVAAFSLNADSDTGWFAGTLVSSARFDNYFYHRNGPQLVADAGFARNTDRGWSWELGLTGSWFPQASVYDYHELFAGVTIERWNARVYYSPAYYGLAYRSLYGELNYSRPLSERLQLFAHAGLQHVDANHANATSTTLDTRLGLGLQLWRVSIQASWIETNRSSYLAPVNTGGYRRKFLLQVDYAF